MSPACDPPSADKGQPRRRSLRIIAFGSSSTEGSGATSPAMAYPAQLARLFAQAYGASPVIEVLNRGIGGETIDAMMERLVPDVLSSQPDLVIWQAGSNDPLQGVTTEHFEAALALGIGALRATGAEVMLMEPQWCPQIEAADPAGRFVASVRRVAKRQGLANVERFTLMRGWLDRGHRPDELIGPDGLHSTDLGYTLLARAVFEQVVARPSPFACALEAARAQAAP